VTHTVSHTWAHETQRKVKDLFLLLGANRMMSVEHNLPSPIPKFCTESQKTLFWS
jgi:hypothetical protein